MNGTVKWFNRKKGFGFIQGEDGEDYFVHYSQLPKGVFLKDAEEVTFEAAETEKGRQAKNVVTGKGGEAATSDAPAEKPAKKEGKKKKEESEEAPKEESEDFGEEEFDEDSEESEEATEEAEDETF